MSRTEVEHRLVKAFSRHDVGFSSARFPAGADAAIPNYHGFDAFWFFDRVGLGGCACEAKLKTTLSGAISPSYKTNIQTVLQNEGLPEGVVWVHFPEKRDIDGHVLVLPAERWLELLS